LLFGSLKSKIHTIQKGNTMRKTKYWTATAVNVQGKTVVTSIGLPFTSLKEAKNAKQWLNSTRACVVRASEKSEMPTDYIVA